MQFHQNGITGIRASQKEKDLSRLLYHLCGSGSNSILLAIYKNYFSIPKTLPNMEMYFTNSTSDPADNKEESTSKCAANVYTTFPQLPLCQTSQIPSHDFVSIQNALRYPSFMGLHINSVYIHSAVLALFASLVAPFGGFFSSALKRSMGRKDFSNALGSHGGFADRFDCKGLMCTFAYGYLSAVLSEHNVYSSGAGPSIMRLS